MGRRTPAKTLSTVHDTRVADKDATAIMNQAADLQSLFSLLRYVPQRTERPIEAHDNYTEEDLEVDASIASRAGDPRFECVKFAALDSQSESRCQCREQYDGTDRHVAKCRTSPTHPVNAFED